MSLKSEYKRERNRIQRFIRDIKKRGFDVDFQIPDIPKRITSASVERLRKIKPEAIYKKSSYITDTGEKISGVERRKQERSEASYKGWETRTGVPRSKYGGGTVKGPHIRDPRIRHKHPLDKERRGRKKKLPGIDYIPEPEKPDEKFELINRMIDLCDQFMPGDNYSNQLKDDKNREVKGLRDLLLEALSKMGDAQYVEHLKRYAGEIQSVTEFILYKSSGGSRMQYAMLREAVAADLSKLARIFNGDEITLDENTYYSDMTESDTGLDIFFDDEE